jgi:hypothetical protein
MYCYRRDRQRQKRLYIWFSPLFSLIFLKQFIQLFPSLFWQFFLNHSDEYLFFTQNDRIDQWAESQLHLETSSSYSFYGQVVIATLPPSSNFFSLLFPLPSFTISVIDYQSAKKIATVTRVVLICASRK